MTQLTLRLSDAVARQAATLAALEGKPIEDYLSGIVEENVAASPAAELQQLAKLSDSDVLALADFCLTADEDHRLGALLAANRERQLSPAERDELDGLMRITTEGTIKRSLGLAEAVRRKLREPPQV